MHVSESYCPKPSPHIGPHLGRLRWHSRRALLELDLLLERFWMRYGDSLDAQQAVLLEGLLELEDHDLWDVLCGRREIDDPRWQGLIELLLE
ncbi:MAG: succinate dehydrogenase assembly factor 2 [Betaproteobacteria bacterium]|nr:succinate dehydrogenase assembly factor 2 [Betaproteobacteria bacterium]